MARGLRLDKDGKLKLSEADVIRQIEDFLDAHGWRVFVMGYGEIERGGRVVAVVGEEFMPDRQAIRYKTGAFAEVIWLEFKRPPSAGDPGGRLSAGQKRWIEREQKRGAACFVPDNLEEFQVWYRETIGSH
jgi:hypothetical protein